MAYLALIDYGSGNLHSAERALRVAAAAAQVDLDITVTDDPGLVAGADRIVLPGVGHFADCAKGLFSRTGLVEALETAFMYLYNTPEVYLGAGACQLARRFSISSSLISSCNRRWSTSMVMLSPSFTSASGPPTCASGQT